MGEFSVAFKGNFQEKQRSIFFNLELLGKIKIQNQSTKEIKKNPLRKSMSCWVPEMKDGNRKIRTCRSTVGEGRKQCADKCWHERFTSTYRQSHSTEWRRINKRNAMWSQRSLPDPDPTSITACLGFSEESSLSPVIQVRPTCVCASMRQATQNCASLSKRFLCISHVS